jgi:hypothetical protein
MKKFLCKTVLFACIIALAVIPVNVLIDPYNVFHADRIRDNGVESNKNYVKTRYVIANPDKFDSYLFGSSRVGFLDVEKMTGGTYYDMMYSEGLPYEHLQTLKAFISHGEIPKNVIIGVDDISCFVDPSFHEGQLYRLAYPYDGSLLDKAGFYLRYLDTITTLQSLSTIRAYGEADESAVERYYSTGTENLNLPTAFDESANTPYWADYYELRLDEVIADITGIKELCDEYGINLIIFTNPLHATTYTKDIEYGYLEFLRLLAQVTPYYNFSGFNDVTCNNEYYYETSHYSPAAGDLIIDTIFNGTTPDNLAAQGFGTYVTADNVDEVLNLLTAQAVERGITVY